MFSPDEFPPRLRAALDELAAALLEAASAPPGQPDELLDVDAASGRLGIGRTTLYALIGRGEIRSVRAGRRRLVPASAIAEFAASTSRA